jgi:hypothetical protein
LVTCAHGQIPGITYDGGYADYMIAAFEALALILMNWQLKMPPLFVAPASLPLTPYAIAV